jgi:hypothetical protein
MKGELIITTTILFLLTNARADDKRIIPKHAHVGSDGSFYSDTGYVATADLSRCVPDA